MNNIRPKITTDIVLAGGGHAHVQVLKRFAMKPLPGVRLTLISPDPHSPYSGMLPGLIAGHYNFDETHIDLNALCRYADARFIMGEITGLELEAKRVLIAGRPALNYDYLSIDTGSTPQSNDIPGAAEFAVPVKPISRFLSHWRRLEARAMTQADRYTIAVVGAGAGGVEVLLAAQHALQQKRDAAGVKGPLVFHLFTGGASILPAGPPRLRAIFARILHERGVHVHVGSPVISVEKNAVLTTNGGHYKADEILWVTNAGAPQWPAASGLAVDDNGFIAVAPTLQSLSHPDVFAAGDVAAMTYDPRPKAGVYAVRQGPVLADNLRRAVEGRALGRIKPQHRFLTLVTSGDRYAAAARNGMSISGAWVWRWKDWIDRRFMAKFNDLPDMPAQPNLLARLNAALFPPAPVDEDMRCGGCGAKIGDDVLKRALSGLAPLKRPDVLIGLDAPDDAAAVHIPDGKISVQTIDAFRAMIGDPYLFGKIAANHALGDFYAMGAEQQTALAIVTLPPDAPPKIECDLAQMMQGAVEVLNAAGAALVGGHTAEGAEMMLGFAVNGLADPAALLRKSGLRDGDVLILTKALGSGALLAADMRHRAKGRDVAAAVESMLLSNTAAARVFHTHNVSAATDVTGFGLAGHLLEMLRASNVSAQIDMQALPVLEGAVDAMNAGMFSSMQGVNVQAAASIDTANAKPNTTDVQILFDPQTAGGLLAAVPSGNAAACLDALQIAGYLNARIVGRVTANNGSARIVLI